MRPSRSSHYFAFVSRVSRARSLSLFHSKVEISNAWYDPPGSSESTPVDASLCRSAILVAQTRRGSRRSESDVYRRKFSARNAQPRLNLRLDVAERFQGLVKSFCLVYGCFDSSFDLQRWNGDKQGSRLSGARLAHHFRVQHVSIPIF